ncbi:MAG: hypothetical protein U0531_08240, partial [Dehalococcoidia bacterium]
GKFALAPARGPWGTPVTARATGMAPNTEYNLVWTSVDGEWKLSGDGVEYHGREYKPVESVLAKVTSDAQGGFEASFRVPEEFGFQHDVLVKRGAEINNKAGFDVDMQVAVTPSSGPPGTPITIEAKGIGWRQLQNSWTVSYDNNFTGWLSAVTTKGRAKAVIPATGTPGVHVITVLHGDFTFPYMNMQQSPEPDRPQFRLLFTVTDGPPALPPDVATQALSIRKAPPPADKTAIWADPPEGIVGSRTTIHGKGLSPNAEFDLTWGTVTGNRVSGSGWEERERALTRVKTDGAGAFSWTLDVPDDLGGAHTLLAKAGGQEAAKGAFTILPSAQKLPLERIPAGSEFMIQLNGVGWSETANIYHLVYDNSYVGYACGFNSGGNVQVFLRATGTPGWHFIDLYPGIYKGKETRPLNFRIPQLTYADDHPGERLPAFRYAIYVTDGAS